jgi:ferrous iron transport protein B
MKKVAIVGNPNVGKSLVFSRLTGVGVISSNYAGTTVGIKIGKLVHAGEEFELIDLPGIYSLEVLSSADSAALEIVNTCDIVINVADATNLERNLNLTLGLLALGKPMVVCLNLWDDTAHNGISIDLAALQRTVGVPVVAASALRGEGISRLVEALHSPETGHALCKPEDNWSCIGTIVGKVQKLSHRHHTFWEMLTDFTLHPAGGLVFAGLVLAVVFAIVRFAGESLASRVFEPLFTRVYDPFVLQVCSHIPIGFLRELLVGRGADPLASFGILTTGMFIATVLVFPYFVSFYLLFGLLEDVGYLPRIAVVLDTFFHRLGLHGYSSIPVMLGLGCKVPAFLATRVLSTKREKILTMSLILMSAPCLPQSAMIISLGMKYGTPVVLSIFAILLFLAIGVNAVLNKTTKGETPELFMEIPSYRLPSIRLMARKLWIRIVEYFVEVFPMIAVGVLIINILDSLSVIRFVSNLIGVPLSLMLGLPRNIAPVLILGFLRKDVSIALLAPFGLSAAQFVVASVFMVLYVPCVASFFTITKELGMVSAARVMAIVFGSAVGICALLNWVFVIGRMWGFAV